VIDWYFRVWERGLDFAGRSQRAEFWWFYLCNLLITSGLAIIGQHFVGSRLPWELYGLAVLIPSLAVRIRRLHDTDRSGWWLLLELVPVLGWIVLLVFFCEAGQPAENRFGPDPRVALPVV